MGEIVSGVASALLAKLATSAYRQIVLASGLKGDVRKLRDKMDIINGYLVDAESKQVKEHSITKWLQQLKEALFDASDILDEIEWETLRNQVVKEYASVGRKVRRFFSCSNPLAFRIKMSCKIRDIRERINELALTGDRLGLAVIHHRPDSDRSLVQTLSWRETHSSLPSRVIGREQEKKKVISDLMRPNSDKIDVIPIVGIGGVGKTTLAQLVCNDKSIVDNFQLQMWVCVSEEFEIRRLMLEILKVANVTGRDVQNSNLEQVKTLLHEALHGKKFLLVLDDIWDEDVRKWQQLKDVLLGLVDGGNTDSKIIVTTRSHKVASIMGNVSPHKLEELPKKECLELFFNCVFLKGEEEKHPSLKEIGKEIVKKCKGVPLALVTLGCLLHLQYDEREWKKIRDSELWEIDQSKEGSILPALKLSYNHLPPQLKQCFSLCSIFPKDYIYGSCQLIALWMAHGFLQSNNDKEEPEYVGELYIKMLVAISFFQPPHGSTEESLDILGYQVFKMHDLVHDLALSMMRSDQATVTNDSKLLLDEKVRYLSFLDNVSPLSDLKLNKVRTIISQRRSDMGTVEFVNWICNSFKHLRMLDFEDSNFQYLPDCLGEIKHLRYLSLQMCSTMEKLPNSISKLQNLQFLNLVNCKALEELPESMGRYLVSVRCFIITAKVPNLSSIEIGCFKCLQFLMIFSCENLVSLPRELRNLISLKKLVVFDCPKLIAFEDDEDEKARKETQVVNKFNLQTFVIGVLPKLMTLPKWLTRYAINSLHTLCIARCENLLYLPADMNQLRSLRHLYIINCNPQLEAKYREDPERTTRLPHVHIQFEAPIGLYFESEKEEV